MITAPLLQTGVEIDLPDAAATPIADSGDSTEPLILSVSADGEWYLNVGEDPESPMAREEILRLASAVLRINPSRRVLVAGDKSIDYRFDVGSCAIDHVCSPAKISSRDPFLCVASWWAGCRSYLSDQQRA